MNGKDKLKEVLARPVTRYLASIIDGTIIFILAMPIYLYASIKGLDTEGLTDFMVFAFLLKLGVYIIFDVVVPYFYGGKTVGRMVMKITLYQENGKHAGMVLYLRRASIFIVIAVIGDIFNYTGLSFGLWAVVFALSIYWIYVDILRQTVHDKVAGSVMIDDEKRRLQKENG